MENYFDTHCHLDFLANPALALEEARACGVNRILVPSVHPANFLNVIELADRYEGVYYTLGIHPCFVAKTSEDALKVLEKKNNKMSFRQQIYWDWRDWSRLSHRRF